MVGAAAVGLAASAIAAAPSAAAQPSPSNCTRGDFLCLYENNDYEGGVLVLSVRVGARLIPGSRTDTELFSDFAVPDFTGLRFNNGHSVQDAVSSVANNSRIHITCYRDRQYGGETFGLKPNFPWSTVGKQNDGFSSCRSDNR
jgi:hypothetical protein